MRSCAKSESHTTGSRVQNASEVNVSEDKYDCTFQTASYTYLITHINIYLAIRMYLESIREYLEERDPEEKPYFCLEACKSSSYLQNLGHISHKLTLKSNVKFLISS